MKVIKIVIDDEEEKALSPEAEELLRRRAAEVGFSTLDWIVQLLNSTRNKTTKTNRKTRTSEDLLGGTSPLKGSCTGISSAQASKTGQRWLKMLYNQRLTSQFPTHRNREFFAGLQGI